MTVWERYSQDERDEYEDFLKMYGALSAMFNQKSSETGAPYLDSKFQETIYAKSFQSEDVDIGNTPHDIMSTFGDDKIGIGLKTWLSSKRSYQKVMQLKRYRDKIDPLINENTKDELAYTVATIKNERLNADYSRLGLSKDKNIYHYVTRDRGLLKLSETSYPLVDMDKLKPGKLNKSSFTFTDGLKEYKYTFGDSQIWMRFGPNESDTHLLDSINIDILDDPFTFLKDAFKQYKNVGGVYVQKKPERDYIYIPLYSYKRKKVYPRSGLNAWNGDPKTHGSTYLRPEGEAYLPIPKDLWKKRPFWFNPSIDMRDYAGYKQETGQNSYKFNLHFPNGKVYPAIVGQANFKSLETKPQSALGKWIFNSLGVEHPQRVRYDQPSDDIITMDRLMRFGLDSVKLWHKDLNDYKNVWIDFAEYGSFERFMKDEMQVQDESEE